MDIPHGKTECLVDADMLYVRWAPGTGFVYQIIASDVPIDAADRLGGHVMVSMECAGTWISEFFGDVGLWHETLVQEHFNASGKMHGQEVLLYVALLNWTMGNGKTAMDYAEECWKQAGVRKRL